MKILIFIACFLVFIEFSGMHAFLDTHVFAWLPAAWIDQAHTAVKFVIGTSIVAYGALYLYYAQKNTDKAR